ncbi:protein FAR1-RELATED SEQUENCE 4-like isoform X3 [Carya illinoinensis]|uniref:protein FAR1-RELATED SEQUENCE 4-like isoform X3 n=1 Tax=Carya illinoinensis TaxID=32201 RepID=UPI001C7273CA|nr:protein FAR1-RELATED SEQUENCE 4-like isoform X3 [Carya illinoinensis]XP_042978110.1 protein FAR1-RELATED SEQUENCE 4-like isoform X3 [Carya illinoinensis]
MSYPQPSNPDDFNRVEDPCQYPSSGNPYASLQESPECPEFSENVGCTFDDAADEMYLDIEEDLEGSTVVPDDEVRVDAPRSGMEFESVKELLGYYKKYAKQEGFGVRTQRTKRDDDGRPVYVTVGCARGGKYQPKHKDISKPRPTTKTDCKAKVNATLKQNEKWLVTTVENTHNHITVSPKKTRLLRSHKVLDEYSQRILELNDRAGIRMNKNYYSLVVDAGGFENLEFQEKDCRNFIDKSRHLRLGKGGGEALRVYFQRMRQKNDGFVYDIDVDDEGRLRNVFWADARCRASYECFGDVVTFDTTYLTNRYGMPFAPFIGVNHHGQSILLGAGLLSSEDTHTFIWLFRMWLDCMNGRAPKAIITDQDRAMKNAIALVFPGTRHRYCLWHIMRKLPEKLGSHSHFSSGLKSSIQAALYDSHTSTEFEERWGQLLDMYDLRENNWLKSLYEERTFWVPVYLKDVFWAGMSTTQRSESMNAFFDGYVHSGTTLKEFVDQFDNALRKKVEVETTADFNSINQTIPCVSPFNFEKQFQKVYTATKFKEFQKELMGLMCCNCTMVSQQGCISTFDILDEIAFDDCTKIVHYTVYYNEEECELKCTCALFEMRGILCRHALRVCQFKRISVLPERYVLDRWRKDEKRRYTLIPSSYDDCRASGDARRYEMVVKRCMKLATKISPSSERVNAFLRYVDDFDSKCDDEDVRRCNNSESTVVGHSSLTDKGKKLLSPHVVRGKGRPPIKRKVPPLEKLATKRKRKTTCRLIFENETTFLNSPASQLDEGVERDAGVGDMGTQNSVLTQGLPLGNDEVLYTLFYLSHFLLNAFWSMTELI